MTRLRPVVMTALAMIIGMLPMSLGLGEGGEQNAPLGRAVIGGLTVATFATLFFVPVVYSALRTRAPHRAVEPEVAGGGLTAARPVAGESERIEQEVISQSIDGVRMESTQLPPPLAKTRPPRPSGEFTEEPHHLRACLAASDGACRRP